MGRELRRVPLDFDWPIGEIWSGYINPHWSKRKPCPGCDGTGSAPKAKLFSDQWYGDAPFDPVAYGAKPITIDNPGIRAFASMQVERNPDFYCRAILRTESYNSIRLTIPQAIDREIDRLWNTCIKGHWRHHLIQADVDALIEDERLHEFTHDWIKDKGWVPKDPIPTVTPEMVNNGFLFGMGHDSINKWVCVKARCLREGADTTCPKCDGDGHQWPYPEAKAAYEEWKDVDPPTGDGYQLWSTTSEGNPASPVFATLDELCSWCQDNATTFGSNTATADEWREMLDGGVVCHKEGNNIFL